VLSSLVVDTKRAIAWDCRDWAALQYCGQD
jgi:hypothetical protein